MDLRERLDRRLAEREPEMVSTLCDLVALPSVSPQDGGLGEGAVATYLEEKVRSLGLAPCERYDAPDPAAPGGARPNRVVRMGDPAKPRLWFFTHTDVVPEGDRSLWDQDPFVPQVRQGRIYGRGASDNKQELVASLYALATLTELGAELPFQVCLAFVADEEMGSRYGICHLLDRHPELFSPQDLVLAPDGGNEAGDFIEIAEKTPFWLEFTVEGRQVHGSRPDLGINACRAANELSVALDRALHQAFPEESPLFEPPVSTFEPTRRQPNVANVNTIPGRETFCFDCRLLPSVDPEAAEAVVREEIRRVEERTGARIAYRFPQRGEPATPTDPSAPVVQRLARAVTEVLGVTPRVGGVAGGTCAAFFRVRGIPAAVWAQENDTAHMPGEYAEVSHLMAEARVFGRLMAGL